MKKICAFLLAAGMMFACATSVFAAGMGDVAGNDNRVTAADARAILRAAVGLDSLPAQAAARADMDLDGKITAADARLALRTAVGLEYVDGKTYATQLDVLKSGHYYVEMTMYDDKGAIPMRIAVTENSLFMGTTLEGVTLTILSDETQLFFIDESSKTYAVFSDEIKALMSALDDEDFDPVEMFVQVPIFSGLPDLQTAVHYEGTYNGVPCDCYMEDTGLQKTTVYMDGPRLLASVAEDRFGDVISEMVFQKVLPVVSTENLTVPGGYTEMDFLEFILENYPELLTAEL